MIIIKHIIKSVAVITFFSVITRISGFLFKIYLSRELGSEALGIYQVGFSIFIVLATIFSSGIPLTVSKLTASYKTKNDCTSEYKTVSASFIVGTVLSIAICILCFIFKNQIAFLFADRASLTAFLYMLPSIVSTAMFSAFRGSFWGHSKHFIIGLADLIEQFVRIILCVILMSFALKPLDGIIAASVSISVACFTSVAIIAFAYFKNGKKLLSPKGYYAGVIKSAAPITGVRVSSSLVQPLIAVIIPLRLIASGYTSSQALSVYGVAIGMTFPLLFIPITLVGALSVAIIPGLSSLMSNNNCKEASSQIRLAVIFSTLTAACILPVYIGIGKELGLFLFNNYNSGVYLSQSAMLMIPISISAITASCLNALGLEIKSFKNYLIGSVFTFLSIWFLTPHIGISSLVVGMFVCMSLVSILNIFMIEKRLNYKLKILKPLTLILIFTIPSTLIANWSYNLIMYYFPTFISLGISGSLAVGFFITLSLCFEIVNLSSIFVSFKNIKVLKRKKAKAV